GQRVADDDALLEAGLVCFETIAGGRRVTAHHAPVAVHVAVAHEEHRPVLGVPDHAQGLETAAAAVLAVAAGVGFDVAPQIKQRLGHFPDFDVAHVAFRIPDGGGVVQAILDGAGAGAARRGFETIDRVDLAVLVDAAALQPVGGIGVAGIDLFQIAAAEVGLAEAAPQRRPAGDQEVPGIGVTGAAVVRIAPGALRQVELGREVGAVVDALGRDQGLRHHDPDARGEGHLVGIEGVPAPAAGAFEVEPPLAVRLDGHLDRRVHNRVELGEGVGNLDVLVLERHIDEGHLAIFAGQRHRLDPAHQAAAAFFDDFLRELLVGFETVGPDHFIDQFANHVAAGDAGLFVENPVFRRAHRTLRLMQPVAQRFVVHPGLAAGDHVAVAETLRLTSGHRAWRHGAGIDDVSNTADPADQLAGPEDRHDG